MKHREGNRFVLFVPIVLLVWFATPPEHRT
jgi:hypothetical protein